MLQFRLVVGHAAHHYPCCPALERGRQPCSTVFQGMNRVGEPVKSQPESEDARWQCIQALGVEQGD